MAFLYCLFIFWPAYHFIFWVPGRRTAQVTRTLETAVERMNIRLFVEPKMPAERRDLLKKVAGDLAGADPSRGDLVEVQELTAPPAPAVLANRDIPWTAIVFSVTALLSAIIIAAGLAKGGATRGGGFGSSGGGRGAGDEGLAGEPIEEGTRAAGAAMAAGPGAIRAFPGLAGATPDELVELLGEVEPVVAAVVLDLVGLDPATMRRLFERLPHERQLEIGMTLGTGRMLLRPALSAMETAADTALAKVRNRVLVGGPGRLADLLAQAPAASQQGILDAIAVRNGALAEAVRARMVFFGDLAGLADASVRQVVTSVDPATVALALVGAPEQLREVVTSAVSKRLRAILEAELEVLQERPAAEIEAARKTVEAAMHRLHRKSELLARAA